MKTETTVIKIWGLERSGTNFLKYFIEQNFKNVLVLSNIGGHKHDPFKKLNWQKYDPNKDKNVIHDFTEAELKIIKEAFLLDRVKHILIYKNPALWILSYLRYKKIEIPFKKYGKLLKLRNKFHKSFFNTNSEIIFINYEEFLPHLIFNFRESFSNMLFKFGDKLEIKPILVKPILALNIPLKRMRQGSDKRGKVNLTEIDFSYTEQLRKEVEAAYLQNCYHFNESSKIEKKLQELTFQI